jgi:hypothetical protein
MRPLPAAAATRVDASSTSAASVHRCSATQIHPRLARSASSQHRASACARWMRPICKVDDTMQVQIDEAASCGRCYMCRSQPDLLTSSHSRLPGSSPQVTSRPVGPPSLLSCGGGEGSDGGRMDLLTLSSPSLCIRRETPTDVRHHTQLHTTTRTPRHPPPRPKPHSLL